MLGKCATASGLSLKIRTGAGCLVKFHPGASGLLQAGIAKREPAAGGFRLNRSRLRLTPEASAFEAAVWQVETAYSASQADGHPPLSGGDRPAVGSNRLGYCRVLAAGADRLGITCPNTFRSRMCTGRAGGEGRTASRLGRHLVISLRETVRGLHRPWQFGIAVPAPGNPRGLPVQDLRSC